MSTQIRVSKKLIKELEYMTRTLGYTTMSAAVNEAVRDWITNKKKELMEIGEMKP